MHTHATLLADLRALGVTPGGVLLVHSSLRSLGSVQGGAATVLDALQAAVADGLLVLPTHSWETINEANPVFDPLTTPSCVGALSQLFLHRPGVVRSWHPTHSVAAWGRDAATFAAGEETSATPCPRSGCHGKLYDLSAQILFLGCSLKSNTFLHGVEEWNDVPHRLEPEPMLLSILSPDGNLLPRPMHPHALVEPGISERYDKIAPLLLAHRLARQGHVGDAPSWLCQARPMADLVSSLLRQDPDWFAQP